MRREHPPEREAFLNFTFFHELNIFVSNKISSIKLMLLNGLVGGLWSRMTGSLVILLQNL